jgi:ribosomal protein L11 methyltransferase
VRPTTETAGSAAETAASATAGGATETAATETADTKDDPETAGTGTETAGAGTGAWLELAVEADLEAVEAVSEILGRVSGGGTTVEPAFDLVDEGLGARVDPARPAMVRGYVPARDASAAEAAAVQTAEALGHLQAFGLRAIGHLQTRIVHEADWAEAWKAFFPVLRVGRRIVIRPTWRRHRREPDDVVLALDPGMAFGTGLHPTTRLCLAALESIADDGRIDGARVLDVGCGSGILAIAALKLDAAEALGVDTDPIAIESTLANARRNQISGRIRARTGSLPSAEPPFDVVLANLIAGVLVQLARALRDELRAGGTLVASGIFIDREPEVRGAFEAVGLVIGDRSAEGDWVALTAVRPG